MTATPPQAPRTTPQSATAPVSTAAGMAEERANALGAIYMLGAILAFSVMDATIKWLALTYPVIHLVFFRNFFAFIPIGLMLAARRDRLAALKTRNWKGHALRAFLGLSAMILFFYAFALMPLAEVVAIAFSAPLFITALSVPLLGERVGPRRWAAVVVGFVGVLVILRPGTELFQPIATLPLLASVFLALSMIQVRKLTRTETNLALMTYVTAAGVLLTAGFLPFGWIWPAAMDWPLIVGMGIVGGGAQYLLTQAFRHAPAALIAPLEYSGIIWAGLLGYWLFGELPDVWVFIGSAIVIASGLYILHRETRLSGLRHKPEQT
ncbi:MAG: DMT family transporter [Alphaproteobacteria bacterium]|nr:DMT family transporter [Alphaproteobacteria bacterium]MBU0888115.1 DMT family transporter [Alphaproteobacteria bacterium]MBU1811560.1 DMT family transporter [Alphaproteobacteria bacterium]